MNKSKFFKTRKEPTNHEHFQLLVDHIKDYAIFVIDAEGYVITWNDGAEAIKGYTAEEILGRHFSVFYTPQQRENGEPERNLQAALREGRLETQALRVRKDGSQFWANIVITPLYDEGKLVGFGKVTRDITESRQNQEQIRRLNAALEQKRLDEKIAENEKKYRYLFEKNPMPLWIIDKANFQFLDVNEAAIKNYGYSREEFLNMTALDIRPEEERERFLQSDAPKIVRPFNSGIWKHLRKDRTTIYVEVVAHEMILNEKNALLVLSHDVTEEVKIKEEIVQLNEQLENRVNQRTQQLEAVNKELEAFSYSVSHDLRAPLRAVSGYARMLKEDYAPEMDTEANRIIDKIISNAKMMGQLIDDLLDFSRMGRKEVRCLPVDMKAMAEACLDELFQLYPAKTWQIAIQELPPCTADPVMIKQLWMNLLNNALKYSSKTLHPQIEVGYREDPDMHIYFVRDNGVGFDMEYYDKLFGVFQRLHSQEEFEGTGVGLALVYRIITKHNGSVWADGTVNKGATFYFSLPKTQRT